MAPNGLGQILAKLLFIDLNYRRELRGDPATSAGESVFSATTADPFHEAEPTTLEWIAKAKPSRAKVGGYINSLFPFWSWIFHYNLQWLVGDVIAGMTVGFVVVPQGMAYALLAQLPAEYGLYTSFVGFLLYWAFATSKDITIGAVAVMSTIVGNIILKVRDHHPQYSPDQIARALSVVCGAVLLFIGLIRCGWIVEFIPLVAITSFMTGAAISIAVGQLPALFGIKGINTREAPYKVFINSLKGLHTSKMDAAMGLSALFLLYAVRIVCDFMTKKQPHKKKLWFFISTLRLAFVILFYTLVSWLVNRHVADYKKAKFKILGPVPKGFQHSGVPHFDTQLVKAFAPELPAAIIVLIIEHIAISKSFGRINNYVINPSQELVAIGFTNILGPFLGGYPATGSFSRTAIKSKAGVRTPLAGVFTAVIVLLALYALTRVFFFIPMASLAALIIHAVGDLITPPKVVYHFWEISPAEVIIFFGGVFVTIFTSIENGIYLTICASIALLLFRLAMAKGTFLGRVKIYRVAGNDSTNMLDSDKAAREAFIPTKHQDGSNPNVEVQSPYPGIFIYRFSEGFNYPNAAHYLEGLTEAIFKETRRTRLDKYEKLGDRPWNDPGPRRGKQVDHNDPRPILRAVILDFSSVNHIDVTSIQGLIDVRNQLDRHAEPEYVEWHIASINNRWTKRALAAAGFGYPTERSVESLGHWKPIFSLAAVEDSDEATSTVLHKTSHDLEADPNHLDGIVPSKSYGAVPSGKGVPRRVAAVHGINRPYFHIDVAAAVESAVANIEIKTTRSSPSATTEYLQVKQ